ncbi:MAG: shikimate kinase, partial [Acidimicrobiales bacterium]
MRSRIVLVGMMGAGKSSVGGVLASRLGWDFVDADVEVERRAGMSVAELFSSRGEAAFREEEATVMGELLACAGPTVIAAGGGAVLDPATRR